jgi:DUF1680 family protein
MTHLRIGWLNRRAFLRTSVFAMASTAARPELGWGFAEGRDGPRRGGEAGVQLFPGPETRFQMHGPLGDYLERVTEQWLKVAPDSNPAMLEMFRDRDRRPLREMVPWAGEFAGKYLTSGVQVLRLQPDRALQGVLRQFVVQLTTLQADDGYLGPWPRENRLTGWAPNIGDKGGATWDAWGHYHLMIGLLFWHEETGDPGALTAARRIGDLFCTKFANTRLVDTGSTEMNLAPIHSLGLLYGVTGEAKYLRLAQRICDEFSALGADGKPLAGDYLESALNGKEFFQMPKPRWESLHPIMGLVQLYASTGEDKYRRAFESIWWSIVQWDRHNNGGFSSGEQAQGNPYHPGAIETCCTIAWIALGVEMLRLTANSVVADELELSTLNSVLGLHSPSGRWVTYNTPMDGMRRASAHDIVFQARAGSPELNCCSVNGARGLGMISDWALLRSASGSVILNWYGPCLLKTRLGSGATLVLQQETEYPKENRVTLRVAPSRPATFTLELRIPYWSAKTEVRLNGQRIPAVAAGGYLPLARKWKRGDTVEIDFDFTLHFWAGERECAGKTSIFRGPILLAFDRRYNAMDPDAIPSLKAANLKLDRTRSDEWLPPMLLLEGRASDGRAVRLCDFASAGVGGSPYRSWLNVEGVTPAGFSRANPLRTQRAQARE